MDAMRKPECTICSIKFDNMQNCDVHMKIKHNETDDIRISRLTAAVKTVRQSEISNYNQKNMKSLDCTECGLCFVGRGELRNHNESEHAGLEGDQKPNRSVEIMIDDMIEKVIDLSETESLDSDNEDDSDEEDEDEINIDYQYSVEKVKGDEVFKGKKPLFVQTVKAFKQLLSEKGDKNGKMINKHRIVVKDVRDVSYGIKADI